jgi:hypothetical protein
VKLQIEDAAVYSNCLTLVFAVRGFQLPSGLSSEALFPPARSIDVKVVTPGDGLLAEPLGDGGGQHGAEQDGKIWLQQFAVYSLSREIPEGQAVTLEVTVTLDEDFQSGEPLFYLVPVVSIPSPGSCP